jgi:hypothetical protein
MKARVCFFSLFIGPLVAGLFVAPQSQAAPAAPSQSTTNSATADVPQSVFVVPSNVKEGRDPFFPGSSRAFTTFAPKIKTSVASVTSFVLNGISGTPEHRLAIINNRTFDTGEEAEVKTVNGRVRIRCAEIREDAVTIEMGAEKMILRLRRGL